MSATTTHTRGTDQVVDPITGEAPGIREILERRTSGETAPPAEEPQQDDAETTARELASWQRRARDAEAGRAEADRARVAAEQHAAVARQGAEDTGFTAIATALAAAQGERDSLKVELKTAGESGNFERMGEITSRLGELGAEIRDLDRGRAESERLRDARLRTPPPAQPVGSPAERSILAALGAPSREAYLAAKTPATADYLRSHPEFFSDQSTFNRLTGAHSMALGRGLEPDTKAYFDFVDKESGMSQPTSSPTHRPADRTPTPGAAPTREAPGPTGTRTRNGDVYVSAEQRKAAEWMGVDPVEYAKEEAELYLRGELPYRRR